MLHEELATVFKISIQDPDLWASQIGESTQDQRLDFVKLPRLYDPRGVLFFLGIHKKFLPPAEIIGQECIYKGQVVVKAPHLKDLFLTQTQIQVPALPNGQVLTFLVLLAKAALVPSFFNVSKKLQT